MPSHGRAGVGVDGNDKVAVAVAVVAAAATDTVLNVQSSKPATQAGPSSSRSSGSRNREVVVPRNVPTLHQLARVRCAVGDEAATSQSSTCTGVAREQEWSSKCDAVHKE